MIGIKAHDPGRSLEAFLGSPLEPDAPFSFKRSAEFDERDEFPCDAIELLSAWGFQDYLVPRQHGGRLTSFEQLLPLLRAVARRDLAVAIGFGATMLGAIPVWLAGDPAQKASLAGHLRNRAFGALALTEEARGSDLASCETSAVRSGDSYLLSGTKWMIGNGTRSTFVSVLARTAPASGPGGLSLFYVQKPVLAPGSYEHVPKLHLDSARGADISGIGFDGCDIGSGALIGRDGAGLALVFKTMQISRVLCAGFSLGAADTALRIALGFVLTRKLYGDVAFAIPAAREALVNCFLDILIGECVALSALRALQSSPEQLSLWSPVVKYFVSTELEGMIGDAATVLGARQFLRHDYVFGAFQKLRRDCTIVSVFDGSTSVTLHAIATQLPAVARYAQPGRDAAPRNLDERLEAVFRFTMGPPGGTLFDEPRLQFSTDGADLLVAGLSRAAGRFDGLAASGKATLGELRMLTGRFVEERRRFDGRVRELVAGGEVTRNTGEWFDLARKHCILHAASACLHTWLFNRDALDGFFAEGDWLVLCLERLLQKLTGVRRTPARAACERVAAEMVRCVRENDAFSITPIPLASAHAASAQNVYAVQS